MIILQLPRMMRMALFMPQFNTLKTYLAEKKGKVVNVSMFRMMIIFFFIFLSNTVLACVYYAMGHTDTITDAEGDSYEFYCSHSPVMNSTTDFETKLMLNNTVPGNGAVEIETDSWVVSDTLLYPSCIPPAVNNSYTTITNGAVGADSTHAKFSRAIYFMLQTLFTIGYGDSVIPVANVEILFACIFMLIGTFVYGLVIANMTSVLANADVLRMRFRQELDTINSYIDIRDVPDGLRQRIKNYYDYVYIKQFGLLEETILGSMPENVQKDLGMKNMKLFQAVPFFSKRYRDEAFLRAIAKKLGIRTYAPGSTLIFQDEKQRELFVVKAGQVEIYTRSMDNPVSSLRPGDYIGDYQLLFGVTHKWGARCNVLFCEVVVLTIQGLSEVIRSSTFRSRFKNYKGHLRGSTDRGAIATKEVYVEKMEKLNKLHESMNKTTNKMKDMFKQEEDHTKKGIILPNNPFHVYWDLFYLLGIIYLSLVCFVRIDWNYRTGTFSFDPSQHFDFLIDFAVDIFFLVDIYLNLRVFAFKQIEFGREVVIQNEQLIQENYTKSIDFKIDVISSLPYDLMAIAFPQYLAYFRLFHLFRVVHLAKIINRLSLHMEDCYEIIVSAGVQASLQMGLATVILSTWTCVGWDVLHYKSTSTACTDWSDYSDPNCDSTTFLKAFYWTFTTFTTVGYGDITPENTEETVFALMIGAFGAAFCAAIIANVTSFVHSVDVSEDNIEHKKKTVKCFLSDQSIERDLQERIAQYYDYVEQEQQGIDEISFLQANFPTNLKDDMMLHITSEMVLHCSFFSGCDSGFVRSIMLSLDQRFYGKDWMILNQSIPANGMFFIKRGTVDLLNLQMQINNKLTMNNSFAEDALLNNWTKNPFLARAASDSEVWFLSRATFNDLLEEWPDMIGKLEKLAKRAEDNKRRSSVSLSPEDMLPALALMQPPSARIVLPEGKFIKYWRVLIMAVIVYNMSVIPFRSAFLYDKNVYSSVSISWIVLDYLGDLIFLIDLFISFRLLAYYHNDTLVTSGSKIAVNYLRSGKWKVQILCSIPLEVLLLIPDLAYHDGSFVSYVQVFSFLRLNKLLRTVELSPIINFLEKSALKAGYRVRKNALRVSLLMIFTFYCSHYFGCVFFFIAFVRRTEGGGDDCSINGKNWVNQAGLRFYDGDDDNSVCIEGYNAAYSLSAQYITALYWATATLTTVGYGDISASLDNNYEVYFAIFALISGTLIYTVIIANLEDIVAQLDVTSSLFKKKLDGVKSYANQQNLKDNLSTRILSYYDYLWVHQMGVSGQQVMSFIPETLANEVREQLIGHQIGKVFFFKDENRDFVTRISGAMKPEKFMPGDIYFYSGECATSLFFLYRGSVKLISQTTNTTYTTLSNCVIGEGEFFMRSFQPCTAHSEGNSESFVLSYNSFWDILLEERKADQFKSSLRDSLDSLHKNSIAYMIEKVKSNLKNAKMNKMMQDDNKEEALKYRVFLPDSLFKRSWDVVGMVATIYYGTKIPFMIAFGFEPGTSDHVLDGIALVFFLLDIYMHYNHFSVLTEGRILMKREEFRLIYVRKRLPFDIICSLPVYFLVYLIVGEGNGGWIWLFALNNFFRVKRFSKYLRNFFNLVESFTGNQISTGVMRIVETFVLVCMIAHWTASIFYYIGRLENESAGLSSDGNPCYDRKDCSWVLKQFGSESSEEGGTYSGKYLTSFYWALYTISTTGYGNITLVTDQEKLFAMVAMIIGAILCDAGITAILTALIENKDHQAGSNNRRIDCAKKYMTLALEGDMDTQNQVIDYFIYEDSKLENIDSEEILSSLGSSLRLEVVTAHCEDALVKSHIIGNFSRGVICSIMREMKVKIAIPNEVVIKNTEPDTGYFVLHSGKAKQIDSAGSKGAVQPGAIISNIEEKRHAQLFGLPVNGLRVVITSARNLPKTDLLGACDPYVEMTFGQRGKIVSSVKKLTRHPTWKEIFYVKLTEDIKKVEFKIFDWNRLEDDEFIGGATVDLVDANSQASGQDPPKTGTVLVNDRSTMQAAKSRLGSGRATNIIKDVRNRATLQGGHSATRSSSGEDGPVKKKGITLIDANGKEGVGVLNASLQFGPLQKTQQLNHSAVTVFAETYCHLYVLNTVDIQKMRRFCQKVEEEPIHRLLDYDDTETVVEAFKRTSISLGGGTAPARKLSDDLERFALTLPPQIDDGNGGEGSDGGSDDGSTNSAKAEGEEGDDAFDAHDDAISDIVFGIDELNENGSLKRRQTLHWDDSQRRGELRSIAEVGGPNGARKNQDFALNSRKTSCLPHLLDEYNIKGPEDKPHDDAIGDDDAGHADTLFGARKSSFFRSARGSAGRKGRRSSFSLGFQKSPITHE